jgi:succinyl-CoA synthetase alpha subunit
MGHAGAIISGRIATVHQELATLEACKIQTMNNPAEIRTLLQSVFNKQ